MFIEQNRKHIIVHLLCAERFIAKTASHIQQAILKHTSKYYAVSKGGATTLYDLLLTMGLFVSFMLKGNVGINRQKSNTDSRQVK